MNTCPAKLIDKRSPEKPKQPPKIDVPVSITDITGREADYSIPSNGFEYVRHQSQLKDAKFEDEELVKKVYYPEMAALLQSVLEQYPGPKPSNIEILHRTLLPVAESHGPERV